MDTTKLTEIATALGVLGYDPSLRLPTPPPELRNVPGDIYLDIVETWGDPDRTPLVASAWEHGRYFAAGAASDKRQFDLPAFVLARLEAAGIAACEALGRDTCAEPDLFFSNRRAFKAGEPDYGRLLSAIMLT